MSFLKNAFGQILQNGTYAPWVAIDLFPDLRNAKPEEGLTDLTSLAEANMAGMRGRRGKKGLADSIGKTEVDRK